MDEHCSEGRRLYLEWKELNKIYARDISLWPHGGYIVDARRKYDLHLAKCKTCQEAIDE